MRAFRDLKVWELSHRLTLSIYTVTQNFPRDELYGLVSQMKRSAASIPTNIAEGCGRNSNAEFARFLIIAAGSASELEYQLILSHDLKFISAPDFQKLSSQVQEIKRMLNGLTTKVKLLPET